MRAEVRILSEIGDDFFGGSLLHRRTGVALRGDQRLHDLHNGVRCLHILFPPYAYRFLFIK